MRNNFAFFENYLAPEDCAAICDFCKKHEPFKATTFNDSQSVRNSSVRWIPSDNQVGRMIMELAQRANAELFNVEIANIVTEIQFTEYLGEEGGHYGWHHDVDWNNQKNYDRKLSLVIQLSDPADYEGGEFSFSEVENPVAEALKKQGSALVFPSYLQHCVSQVTSGTRYSLVSWVWGPRWR